ncbi:MAG: hypothetical protein Q8R70_00365 [Methanoregula sp.]|nr:hypothetical protein [Methanoregula sp.]
MTDPEITIAAQNFSVPLTLFISPGEFLDSTPWYLLIISIISWVSIPAMGSGSQYCSG